MVRSFKIMALMSHRFNNGQHLKVRNSIIAFSRDAFTGEEGNRVPLRIGVELAKDTRNSEAGGVSVEMNREIWIEVTEDRGGGKTTFEFIESFLSLSRPFEAWILPEEGRHGGGDVGITVNESTVEVGEAKEDLDIVNGGGSRPFGDHRYTVGFHRNTVRGDNEAEEGGGGCMEFAFAKLAGQAILTEAG